MDVTVRARPISHKERATSALRLPNSDLITSRKWRFSPSLTAGLIIVCMISSFAIFSDYIAPYDIAKMSMSERLADPSWTHPMGTDLYGRDMFSRVLVGAQLSLNVALTTTAISALPGILMGIMSGLFPGILSKILSSLFDAWMAVPGLLLVVAMTAALGRSTWVLALALGIAGVPTYYRQARAETLSVSNLLYVNAARSLGARDSHIMLHHILPNIMPKLLVLITLRIGGLLMTVSALSFIGLGAQPPEPEWGTLLAEGREYMHQAWWLMFFPGVAIAATVFGLNLLGDGLRDFFDPNLTSHKSRS
jgi:ABC-type dipeptide/oligopeptide/nickel transport system permease subunit